MGAVMETIAVEVRIPKRCFRDRDNSVECETCGHITFIAMEEAATNPRVVPECCGEPMRVPSLHELDARLER